MTHKNNSKIKQITGTFTGKDFEYLELCLKCLDIPQTQFCEIATLHFIKNILFLRASPTIESLKDCFEARRYEVMQADFANHIANLFLIKLKENLKGGNDGI